MSKRGDYHFTAERLGELKSHLVDGGQAWMGTTSPEFSHSLVVFQGPGSHGRATKEGCEISLRATGEGSEDLPSTINLLSKGFMARTDVDQGAVPNFRFYKIVKSNMNSLQVAGEEVNHEVRPIKEDLVTIIRGTSWMSLFLSYFAKVPGAMTLKIPGIFLILMIPSKTVGVGAFAPIRAVLRAVWIAIRIFVDFAMDTNSVLDIWFWAFCISLLWPLYVFNIS